MAGMLRDQAGVTARYGSLNYLPSDCSPTRIIFPACLAIPSLNRSPMSFASVANCRSSPFALWMLITARLSLVSEERQAAQLAGIETLKCQVVEITEADAFVLTVVENPQRRQFTSPEESHA